MPTISVIVPVYKVEKYIHRCVDSILGQTYADFELILVDDGSPDNCGAICDEYAAKDSRVVVIHQENGGLSAARNAGLRVSRGRYIAFVDSDDCIHTKMYETLLSVLDDSDADFVKSNFCRFTDEIPKPPIVPIKVTTYTSEEALHDFMCTEYSPIKHMKSTVCDALYKRKMFFLDDILEITFPVGKINEDTYIFPELILRAKRIAHVDVAYYYYFIREDGIMHADIGEREINSCDLWEHIHRVVSPNNEQYDEKTAHNSAVRYLNILYRIYHSDFKSTHFHMVHKQMLDDKENLFSKIKDARIKRSIWLVRNYPLYLFVKRICRHHIY